MSFTVAHVSGRFDAPSGPLRDWLKEHAPDIAGHTEINKSARAAEIHGTVNNFRRLAWDARMPGHTRGNCGVSWIGERAVYRDSFKCTDLTYQRVGGATVTVWAPIVVLNIDGRNVLFSALHLPSSVEDKRGFKSSRRVLVHHAAARGWRKECRRVARKYNAERVLMLDGNINTLREFATEWYRETFPRLRGAEYARQGRLRPTHGRRAIDRVMHSKGLRAVSYEMTERIEGYDHIPIIVTFEFDDRPRWGARFRTVRQGRA